MSRRQGNGGFILGAIFGASVAAITALLYAPKAGDEIRKDVSKEVDNLLGKARDYRDSVVEKSVELYDVASGVAQETSEDIVLSVKLQADNLKNQFNSLKDEGLRILQSNEDKSLEDVANELAEEVSLEEVKEDVADAVEEVTEEVDA